MKENKSHKDTKRLENDIISTRGNEGACPLVSTRPVLVITRERGGLPPCLLSGSLLVSWWLYKMEEEP